MVSLIGEIYNLFNIFLKVMKINAKFESKVRLMVGSVLSNSASPATTVSIISEEQASQLEYEKRHQLNSGHILNGTGRNLEHQITTKELSVSFPNLQLKTIKRKEGREGAERVAEEKFAIIFWTEFVIGEGDLRFQIWTLSRPVVVIVHGTQEPLALATITWDNAFAKPIRRPFSVEDKVTWGQVMIYYF